jgi:hypothetical protein
VRVAFLILPTNHSSFALMTDVTKVQFTVHSQVMRTAALSGCFPPHKNHETAKHLRASQGFGLYRCGS